jgi:hypothetical protein
VLIVPEMVAPDIAGGVIIVKESDNCHVFSGVVIIMNASDKSHNRNDHLSGNHHN